MLKRNITIGYILTGLNNSFFWFAPWLLFLYKYINIEQVALLQAIGLAIRVASEIPTGAVADLLGKRKTLILSFLLTACGETTMAFSRTMPFFIGAYALTHLGYSFYSGTMDAFMYDTLRSKGKEKDYPTILSRSSAIASFATASATLIGSVLFNVWIGLPFLITGVTKLIGLILAFFVEEPRVDTFKFSLRTFLLQTKVGFHQLFIPTMRRFTLLILLVGMSSAVAYDLLDDVAVVDWGYTAVQIGILYSLLVFLSIPMSLLYAKLVQKVPPVYLVLGGIVLLSLNYLFSPWISVYAWTTLFLVRIIYSPLKTSAISDILNSHIESSVRATTLSSVELINKLPFLIFGTFFGVVMQTHGVKYFSSYYAGVMLILLLLYILFFARKPSKKFNLAVK